MDNPALKTLIADLKGCVSLLEKDVEGKQWEPAFTRAKIMLGLASKTYARLNGIIGALDELGED